MSFYSPVILKTPYETSDKFLCVKELLVANLIALSQKLL